MVHTVFGNGWADGTPVPGIRQAEESIKAGIAKLHDIAPDSGAYFNEVRRFFGSLVSRLHALDLTSSPHRRHPYSNPTLNLPSLVLIMGS